MRPEAPLSIEHTRLEMRERLRELGLRATSPRLQVLCALHQHAGPLSHEELTERLGASALDRATLYRILSQLSEKGLLKRMDLGDKVWRYELLDHCRRISDDHAHFLCTDCGAVTCLPELELRAAKGSLPAQLQGAELHLKVTGRCADCVAQ
ncbi:MAG: Fur family transcriptional regulator [Myxococcota bacterium]|nr:Fur family transcriptional regulator [Myxococcota bacterium]